MEINEIKNKDLFYMVERIEPYFASSIIIRGMLDKKNVNNVLKWQSGVRWLYADNYFLAIKTDLQFIQKELEKKFRKNGGEYADGLVKKCFEYGNKLLNTAKKIENQSTKNNLNRAEMRRLLGLYLEAASRYMIFQNIVLFENPIAKLADALVKKYATNKTQSAELLSLITTSSQPTATEKERDDFLKICLTKNKNNLAARRHARKYGWLSLRFFIGQPWSEKEVMSRLKTIKMEAAKNELKARIAQRQIIEESISSAIEKFNRKDRELVGLIRDIVYLRSQRTDFFQESSFYVLTLIKKIAKELGVSYEDILYLGAPELLLALNRRIDYRAIITKRKRGFVVFFDNDGDKVLESDEALDFIRKRPILFTKANGGNLVLRGKIGYRGEAIGRVKIVKSDRDNIKVKKGDILVAIMTTTNFIPAMRKSAAFVTDEGGVTCHAAILAREMKKPCIIGTLSATKELKDGDNILVDANKGMVKILKRA